MTMPKLVHLTSMPKAEEAKRALAETANRLFREKGFENVGIREIVGELGLTTGSFYYHFKSKADILNYRAREKELWLSQEVPGMLAGLRPREKIIRLLGGYLCDVIEEDGWALSEDRMFAKNYKKRESDELMDLLCTFVEEAMAAARCKPECTAEELAKDLMLVTRGVEYDWCIHRASYDLHTKVAEMVSMVLTANGL